MRVESRVSTIFVRAGGVAPAHKLVLLFLLSWVALAARADIDTHDQAQSEGPYAVVERVTNQVMAVVREKSYLLEEQPEAFYAEVNRVLSPVVAFDYIARGVMGGYASQASQAQRERFSQVFQMGLISTYAKGMVLYGDQELSLDVPREPVNGRRKVSVVQRVKADGGEHVLAYTMGLSQVDGQWKLLNVIINGVNLGHTLRSQFAQSMQKRGDLDAVIEHWSSNG